MDFQDENLGNPWYIIIFGNVKVIEFCVNFWADFWADFWVKFWVNFH